MPPTTPYQQLQQELASPDLRTRLRAIFKAGASGDPRLAGVLQQLAQHAPDASRQLAQLALEHLTTPDKDLQRWTDTFWAAVERQNLPLARPELDALAAQLQAGASAVPPPAPVLEADAPLPDANAASGEQVETVGVYQMFWDCPFCGAEKLLGVTHRHCPNCGASQDTDYRYFPEEGEEVALENHRYVGVDRICPACEGLNSAAASFCGNCGSGLDEAAQAKRRATQHAEEGFHADKGDPVAEQFQQDMLAAQQAVPEPRWFRLPRGRAIWGLVAGLILLVGGGFLFAFLYKQPETVTVTAHEWERIIQIETFDRQHVDAEECSAMPDDAYSVRRWSETRTRRVADGQECREECSNRRVDNGDGSFRTERVCRDVCSTRYRNENYTVQMCEFDIDRWQTSHAVTLNGDDLNPRWPQEDTDYTLAAANNERGLGAERAGEREEIYRLMLRRDSGETVTCEYDEMTLWQQFTDGDTAEVDFNLLNKPDCDSLRAP